MPFVFFVVLWLGGCAGTSTPDLPPWAPPLDLARLDIGPWTPAGTVERYAHRDLELVLGENAAHAAGFGIEELQVLPVARDDREAEIRLYRCRSSPEAFALYTVWQALTALGHAVPIAPEASAREGAVRAWKGRYHLAVRSTGPVPVDKEPLVALARSILEKIAELSRKPTLVRALPLENLLPGSELCFRSRPTLNLVWKFREPDLLGLDQGAENEPAARGIYAQYMFNQEANLFVLWYRDPALAARAAERFVGEEYGRGAKTYRHQDALAEAELADGSWAIAFQKNRIALLVPPTHAREEMRTVIRRYVVNLADLVPSQPTEKEAREPARPGTQPDS
jgi:hypothetical protein